MRRVPTYPLTATATVTVASADCTLHQRLYNWSKTVETGIRESAAFFVGHESMDSIRKAEWTDLFIRTDIDSLSRRTMDGLSVPTCSSSRWMSGFCADIDSLWMDLPIPHPNRCPPLLGGIGPNYRAGWFGEPASREISIRRPASGIIGPAIYYTSVQWHDANQMYSVRIDDAQTTLHGHLE